MANPDNHRVKDHVRGLIVQFQKNSSYHSGIKQSAYSALFEDEACVGLTTSTLTREILSNLESEQDIPKLSLLESASRCERQFTN